jgi:N utilization substance protein A
MNRDLVEALAVVEKEKGISKEILIEAIESALTSAYKKDQKGAQKVRVQLDPETGDFRVFTYKTVVEEKKDDAAEITLAEAKAIDPLYQLGDEVEVEIFPKEFGRIAAQTAKQIVVQRIREAERSLIYEEFSSRVGDIITGVIRRFEQKTVFIDLGRAEAILPAGEQIPGERYEQGARIKTYLVEVKKTTKGPQIILSRTRNGLLTRLLELEVPEIQEGIVEIKAVAREPGVRSKVAVYSKYENVDPVGACVGTRGSRIQMIVRELRGEKIDVIPWQPEPELFIIRALSPARVYDVKLLPSKKMALVIVPDNQLSLAIGKEGQNARLAARLTGWKVDIKSETQAEEAREEIEALLEEERELQAQAKAELELEEAALPEVEEGELPVVEEEPEEEIYVGEEEEEEEFTPDDYIPEEIEEADEEEEERPAKKKGKKRARRRERSLLDEMEEGMDLFEDIIKEDEQETVAEPVEEEAEVVFSHESTSGFTIGQLLADQLKAKLGGEGTEEKKPGQKKKKGSKAK